MGKSFGLTTLSIEVSAIAVFAPLPLSIAALRDGRFGAARGVEATFRITAKGPTSVAESETILSPEVGTIAVLGIVGLSIATTRLWRPGTCAGVKATTCTAAKSPSRVAPVQTGLLPEIDAITIFGAISLAIPTQTSTHTTG